MNASSASARVLHRPQVVALLGRELGPQRQFGHADDGVHRRANLVAHVGEKLALGFRGFFGALLGDLELASRVPLRSVTSRATA